MVVSVHLAIDCLQSVKARNCHDIEGACRSAFDLENARSKVGIYRLTPLTSDAPLKNNEKLAVILDPSPFSCAAFEDLLTKQEILQEQLERVQDALREVSRQPPMSPRGSTAVVAPKDSCTNTTPRLLKVDEKYIPTKIFQRNLSKNMFGV